MARRSSTKFYTGRLRPKIQLLTLFPYMSLHIYGVPPRRITEYPGENYGVPLGGIAEYPGGIENVLLVIR